MNKGKTYIITDDRVEEEQIDLRIGKVTEYSDQEGTYWGNFSNSFPKGTELYNIKGVNIDEAIAIKINEESFIKADYKGEYAGSWFDIYWKNALWYTAGGFLLIIGFGFFIMKVYRK
ncbi:hypothetical protein ACVNS2_18760 [Paenibacillus caseinilyticus]|uniref:Uncharacterized protein n=1 Tax=Paenibacillus mucilaginosus K02 TaxID=997761 RepID=I0BJZ6_9BACL|nr:hypothetical protein [Paenibacillus mucilaginosus]AFH62693.1 hypothetical protein B2K_18535 [Paenibacillus mucilaginosus K02]